MPVRELFPDAQSEKGVLSYTIFFNKPNYNDSLCKLPRST